jgi:8-oxo-dGTP diphosphatase
MLLILTEDGRLLVHLRDDIPGILHPGCWAGFGGAIDTGEGLLEALRREVLEEIGIYVQDPIFLMEENDVEGAGDLVAMYYVKGGIQEDDIDLQEGAGVGTHSFDDLPSLRLTPFVRRAAEECHRRALVR